jgi:three-Cys-motif partner protein
MSQKPLPKLDEIEFWSELKLDILKQYARQYSMILDAERKQKLHPIYIDGFAGAGVHISRTTGKAVPGSPLNALLTEPPFEEFHLIDLDGTRIEHLRRMVGKRTDVFLYQGDCNGILLKDVFPRVRYEDYRRALCLLDPYGLTLDWQVIEKAGQQKTIDLFLNFPVMDMNRNALWRKPELVCPEDVERMTRFWGDESWRDAAYRTTRQMSFFGPEKMKTSNEELVEAFRQRLEKIAGFKFVPKPLPMVNSTGVIVYYLFFASQKDVAQKIASWLFNKYDKSQWSNG